MDDFLHRDLEPVESATKTSSYPLSKNNYSKIDSNELLINAQEQKIGESFQKQGELRLLHGDLSGIQFFDLAVQLNPNDPKLFLDQGLSIFEFATEHNNKKSLLLASKRFKAAVKLNPFYFEAWQAWGHCLYILGKSFQEHHYFIESEQKYKKALKLSIGQSDDVLTDLYWNYGCIWSHISDNSKEPSDMHLALDSFNKAAKLQDDLSPEFWHDYGSICLKLGMKLNDLRFFFKSINCYKNAVSISISSYDSWFHLACCLKTLYSFTHDEDHFSQANECFSTAAQLNSKDPNLWLNWAKILNISGRLIKDPKRLRSAIEKCRRAQSQNSCCPYVVAIWSEALAVLGLLNDKVDLIYEAQNKVLDIIEKHPNIPQLYHALGLSDRKSVV